MGLHGKAWPRAGQRRGLDRHFSLPTRVHKSELGPLPGLQCADRVAHLGTFTFAGEIAGDEMLRRAALRINHICA
jgi:hypothetical protein